WDAKRTALHTRLVAEKTTLENQLAAVQARLTEAAAQLEAEKGNLRQAQRSVEVERGAVVEQQKLVEASKAGAEKAAGRAREADKERARVSAELARLEKELKELQAVRLRDANAWSVVPYRGKHGEKRRPIYIECAEGALVFHPNKSRVAPALPSPTRAEVQRQ